jgi:Gpi18-like mannosyltransferase
MMRFLRHEWILFALLAVAVVMRFDDLVHIRYMGDMVAFNIPWAQTIQQFGLFRIYATSLETDYPPIFLVILGMTSSVATPILDSNPSVNFIVLTKLFSVAAEVAIVGVIYNWLPSNTRIKWIIPLGLALSPGLIATTAFWGQTDSILTLFLILSIIALNRNQSRMSWVWFSVALLMKFQAIVLLPMLGILSLRRFGIRSTVLGILTVGIIFGIVLAPFVISSGLGNTLRPFTGATDRYPVVTVNAFNLWYVVIPPLWNLLPTYPSLIPLDTNVLLANLSIRQISLLLFASYVLVIVMMMWRQHSTKREFLWATALFMGFFMIPTQMHERYLYPAVVFSIIAIAQEKRVWPIALILALTYTVNIVISATVDYYWFGLDLKSLLGGIGLAAGILNLLCLAGITVLVTRNPKKKEENRVIVEGELVNPQNAL